ncbi:chorismate synthase [Coprobacter tertius]|uniref:Chorismate synthase n=1 Tax=Coprobacter tertius TaxID=2944915 RepID=A0ABT1MJZ6_9BACT|nr:chorismate synthase [Coprobacter tertius]MCP9611556.1 chorismate synthase [Coprobacter tertius]
MNTFGTLFRLTSFGESHGIGVGGVIDGMPAGIEIDMDFIQHELDRRRPGQSSIVTPRKENDRVEFFSGIFEGRSTGAPIGFVIYNENQHSSDYDNLRETYRPSHADYTYVSKYGNRDHRGGGRSSARETIARVVTGALAKLALRSLSIEINAFTSQVGDVKLPGEYTQYDISHAESNIVRCPDDETAIRMIELIDEVRSQGDTVGGVITCVVRNVPVGLGDPVFNKLHADLGAAMLGINAVKGFEYGMGFNGVQYRGSQMNDVFTVDGEKVTTLTNHSGGIQGGISNGEDIYFRVAFKPVATILRDIQTVDASGREVTLKAKGRHDPCVLPRAVPIVESMAAMVVLDHYLLNKTKHL